MPKRTREQFENDEYYPKPAGLGGKTPALLYRKKDLISLQKIKFARCFLLAGVNYGNSKYFI